MELPNVIIHVDNGANAHIFIKREHFQVYTKTKPKITQVSGNSANFVGMGIVPVTFGESDAIYLLYPCYHIPDNPQNTLDLAPLKKYNQARSARVE